MRLAQPAQKITLNAAEIAFDEVTIVTVGGTQKATVALDETTEQVELHGARRDSRRPGDDSHQVPRHPQRRSARPVPEQGEQPPLRGDAARGDRCAAHVPVIRRTGLQGDVCAHRHHRRGGPCDLERRGRVSTRPDPRRASTRSRLQRRRRCRPTWWRWRSETSSATKARPTAFRFASARRRTRRT